ncbi:hypothetical protein EYF80_026918 [Liparis tanakae]|uniref:Uncharacterized protein n=1 Tax=Liparis tanakae TaxID=230148 RepID=A0A4Z2HCU4_9TELE|nr:hypothetical protein EYF80_026918 [Liparis tanakae]
MCLLTRGNQSDDGYLGVGRIKDGFNQKDVGSSVHGQQCHPPYHVLQSIVRLGHGGAAEGVGLDDVSAGHQWEKVLSELVPPEVFFFEPVLLDHGTHTAVQDHDPLLQHRSQLGL